MSLLDKVKNLFTEEVEEEVVVKPKKDLRKEVKKENKREISKKENIIRNIDVESKKEIEKEERKIEIAPARRENKSLLDHESEVSISDSSAINKEEKFVFPVYFSDDDFKDLEKPKEESKIEIPKVRNIESAYKGKREEPKKEQRKNFKPSPIISPVYGVLDENYKKEDITIKEPAINYYRSDKITVDDIRNKAYGTLEDEVENALFNEPIVLEAEKIKKEDKELDVLDEIEEPKTKIDLLREDFEIPDKKEDKIEDVPDDGDLTRELEIQKQKIEEINEIIKNNIAERKNKKNYDNILSELDEIEEELSEEPKEEMNNKNEIEDNNIEPEDKIIEAEDDELEESDLFNLIDSMYEKRDEE